MITLSELNDIATNAMQDKNLHLSKDIINPSSRWGQQTVTGVISRTVGHLMLKICHFQGIKEAMTKFAPLLAVLERGNEEIEYVVDYN
ncbi:unnamed protein product [Peronospora effusa]|uniref:Uncharacterized protein n=1 Tax=Peronospora effusa TaxID=542832 RepID=A0A3M6VQJ2_9STRA|nr:hypothetical protein DD238_007036 [Peronospora effusa]RQM10953.1 hypothetical protein DD237_008443 [Peronospora effusa]CAI5719533.1 unnamed protein product [Peronospora effusa]